MTDLVPRNKGETLQETFENNDKKEIERLQARIKELETVNSVLVSKVQHYENMNVVKAILGLTKQYDEIEKKLQETEEKLKKAQAFFSDDGNPRLDGKFATQLENALQNKDNLKNMQGFGSALGGLASMFVQGLAPNVQTSFENAQEPKENTNNTTTEEK